MRMTLAVLFSLPLARIASAQPVVDNAAAPAPAAAPAAAPEEEGDGRTAFNSVFVELGGNGAWYSINYDRILHPMVSARLGVMYMSVSTAASAGGTSASSSSTWMAFPILANFLVGTPNHKLE